MGNANHGDTEVRWAKRPAVARLLAWLQAGRVPENLPPAWVVWPGLLALCLFVPLMIAILLGVTIASDILVVRAVHTHTSPTLDVSMVALTSVGLIPVVSAVVIVADLILLRTARRLEALMLTGLMLGEGIVDDIVKFTVRRPRPQLFHHLSPLSFSFPSGHAMATICLLGMLLYLISSHLPRALWCMLALLALLLVAGIGVSRVYLGVHYPSDVVGAWLAGGAWLSAVMAGSRQIMSRLWPPTPHTRRGRWQQAGVDGCT